MPARLDRRPQIPELERRLRHAEITALDQRAGAIEAGALQEGMDGQAELLAKAGLQLLPVEAFHVRNIALRHMPRRWLGRYFLKAIKKEIALLDA